MDSKSIGKTVWERSKGNLRRGRGGDGLHRPVMGGRRGIGGLRRMGRGCGFGTCTVAAVTSCPSICPNTNRRQQILRCAV